MIALVEVPAKYDDEDPIDSFDDDIESGRLQKYIYIFKKGYSMLVGYVCRVFLKFAT